MKGIRIPGRQKINSRGIYFIDYDLTHFKPAFPDHLDTDSLKNMQKSKGLT